MHLQNRFSEFNRDFIVFVFREQHDSLQGIMIKTVQPYRWFWVLSIVLRGFLPQCSFPVVWRRTTTPPVGASTVQPCTQNGTSITLCHIQIKVALVVRFIGLEFWWKCWSIVSGFAIYDAEHVDAPLFWFVYEMHPYSSFLGLTFL